MSRLFESFEELDKSSRFRRVTARQSFAWAILAAFLVGGEVVKIVSLVRFSSNSGDLVAEAVTAVLWLIFGALIGQVAWERVSR